MVLSFFFLLLLSVLGGTRGQVTISGSYKFSQTVYLSNRESNPVSYQIRATAVIQPVDQQKLVVKLNDLKLFTESKKLGPGNFKERKSVLDLQENHPFLIERGQVTNVVIAKSEELLLVNLKKSFSSLLQFQLEAGERDELDISGHCKVKYLLSKDSVIQKTKSDCEADKQFLNKNVWSATLTPRRVNEIVLSGNQLKSVLSKEEFTVQTNIADFAEVTVLTNIHLELLDEFYDDKSVLAAFKKLEEQSAVNAKQTLKIEKNVKVNNEVKKITFTDVLKENHQLLSGKSLGTSDSAKAALKILKAIRSASFDDIYNSLKAKKNKKIVPQLLDILGAVQTPESHKAAMKYLKFLSKDYNLDLCERYLWSLSTSPWHQKHIITDLMNLAEKEITDEKLFETLIQTIASMVRKYVTGTGDDEIMETTIGFFTNKLNNCSKEDYVCQRIFLKSFSNIGSAKPLELLLHYAVNGPKSNNARAMKALLKVGKNSWTKDVLKAAERIYLSNDTFDSSAKTIALDILLESSECPSSITKIIQILKKRDASKELKEYLLQRLAQISDKNEDFQKNLKTILASEGLNHYDALAPGGLSTAFDRRFMKNGYLSSVQEVKSGILKQGNVHINMELNGSPQTVFTLGLFSNGLSSFVSDDSGDDGDESTNAGLELTVMGVEFRPFVFFEGHGELMGHVFSGAGSTLTPAYQAILLLEDDSAALPLGTGEFLNIRFSSVASVDLSGKIEISLWSRTADSLVQNSAGLIIDGVIEVLSPYMNAQVTLELTAAPQLKLSSNIEFYNKLALCMMLEQPQITVQFNKTTAVNDLENIYKKSIKKRENIVVPGKTYALNSKNNEMCRLLFQGS